MCLKHRLQGIQSKGLALVAFVEPEDISEDTIDMETEMAVIYSATSSTVYSNSNGTTTHPTDVEDILKWTDAEIARLIQIIIRPILVVFGTMGNCLTFYIMRTTSLKKVSSCFYMVVLALADTSKYEYRSLQVSESYINNRCILIC